MSRPRDTQKSKVYGAEYEVFTWDMPDIVPTVSELQGYVDRVLADPWFRARFPKTDSVVVKDGRGRHNGEQEGHFIKMPRWTRSPWYVLHEIAHVIDVDRTPRGQRGASHGPEWVAIFLTLIERQLGRDTARKLRAAYKKRRVKRGRVPRPVA